MDHSQQTPRGIGGWLIFVGLGLFLDLASYSWYFHHHLKPIYEDPARRSALLLQMQIGEQPFSQLLLFETVRHAIIILGSVVLLFLFFMKRRSFPSLATLYYVISTTLGTLHILYFTHLSTTEIENALKQTHKAPNLDVAQLYHYITWGTIALIWIICLIWCRYFAVSNRVAETFTR